MAQPFEKIREFSVDELKEWLEKGGDSDLRDDRGWVLLSFNIIQRNYSRNI